jgi:hypothetical protein
LFGDMISAFCVSQPFANVELSTLFLVAYARAQETRRKQCLAGFACGSGAPISFL